MEFLQDYIILVVLGICLCVGFIIKNSLDFIPNKYIPLIMGCLGLILSIANMYLQGDAFTLEVVLQGLASGLASTGAFELVKNLKGDA